MDIQHEEEKAIAVREFLFCSTLSLFPTDTGIHPESRLWPLGETPLNYITPVHCIGLGDRWQGYLR